MSDRDPSLSVVIPVWDDYVRFLPQAVASVADDAPGVPIVVVDNASTTPVPVLAGIEVVRTRARLSVGAARNVGLDTVATEYVVVLDADDRLIPGALAFMRSRLEADPLLAISVTSILDAATGERHRSPRRFVARLVRRPRLFAVLNCIWSLFPIQGCAMLRVAQARDAGGYGDADWGDDWVLAVSLAFRGRVEVSDRLGRQYRATPDSVSDRYQRSAKFVGSARLVRDRLRVDPAVPPSVRAVLPALGLLQLLAVFVARPVYRAAVQRRYLSAAGRRAGRSTCPGPTDPT
jgi:glycosyltransferase involved in cell wall biosynthesis